MPFQVRPKVVVLFFFSVLFGRSFFRASSCRDGEGRACSRGSLFFRREIVFAFSRCFLLLRETHSHSHYSETRAGRVDASDAGRRMGVEREGKKASSRVGRVSSEVGCEASARGGARNARRRRKKG